MGLKGIRFGDKMQKATEKAGLKENRSFSNMVKHAVLTYLRENHPEFVSDIQSIDE